MAQPSSTEATIASWLPAALVGVCLLAVGVAALDLILYRGQFAGGLSGEHSRWAEFGAPLQARIAARHFAIGTLAGRQPVPAKPEERRDALTAEFFEYKLFLDMADSLGSNPQQVHTLGPDEHGINRISVSIRQRMLPPGAVQVSGETVLGWLQANRLSHLPIEVDQWKRRGLWFPKGAEVRLDSEIVGTIPQRTITIVVPETVTVTIQVEGRGSPGNGILPPAVMVDLAQVHHYSTYGIVVTMHASFHWLSAASPQMQAYKQWVSFVFDRLQQLNADNASS